MLPVGPLTEAVVLVAGTGTRLRPLTDERPKCMVEVVGRPILARLLERLAEAGVTRAWLATGHRADVLEAWLADQTLPIVAKTIPNPRFATTNNAYSLLSTRAALGDRPFVLLDGDVVLAPGVLERLRDCPAPNALLVEARDDMGEEEMKAKVEGDRVVGLAKTFPPRDCFGESIGIQKIGSTSALFETLEAMMPRGGESAYYEAAFQALIDAGTPFGFETVTESEWIEIDDASDLERCEARFRSGAWRA